jgi:hypothetical protein
MNNHKQQQTTTNKKLGRIRIKVWPEVLVE